MTHLYRLLTGLVAMTLLLLTGEFIRETNLLPYIFLGIVIACVAAALYLVGFTLLEVCRECFKRSRPDSEDEITDIDDIDREYVKRKLNE